MVHLRGVEQTFLHVWLSIHKIKEEDLHLRGGQGTGRAQFIQNDSLIQRIKSDFDEFKTREVDLESYFDRDIILFKQTKSNYPFITSTRSVERRPVFTYKTKGKFCLAKPIDQLKARWPIRMPLQHIFSIHDIHHDFVDFSIDECLDLETPHNVECKFYRVENGKAFWSPELPGFRNGDGRVINIGVQEGHYYWLASSNLIQERYYCRKTSKCQFWSLDKTRRDIHEVPCSEESTVRAKQVKQYDMVHMAC